MTRGDIWWVDLGLPFGSEPDFRRPVLIIQSDAFNRSRINTVLVAVFSTNLELARLPGNLLVWSELSLLPKDSVLVCSQVLALDRQRFVEPAGRLKAGILQEVGECLRLVFGLA